MIGVSHAKELLTVGAAFCSGFALGGIYVGLQALPEFALEEPAWMAQTQPILTAFLWAGIACVISLMALDWYEVKQA